jgi:hypothetical protein
MALCACGGEPASEGTWSQTKRAQAATEASPGPNPTSASRERARARAPTSKQSHHRRTRTPVAPSEDACGTIEFVDADSPQSQTKRYLQPLRDAYLP